jgi:hypothetical protein
VLLAHASLILAAGFAAISCFGCGQKIAAHIIDMPKTDKTSPQSHFFFSFAGFGKATREALGCFLLIDNFFKRMATPLYV